MKAMFPIAASNVAAANAVGACVRVAIANAANNNGVICAGDRRG